MPLDENEVNEYLAQMEQELQAANKDKRNLANSQLSMYGATNDDNLVKWQLNLEEEKMRIYHILKGHRLVEDEKGTQYYIGPETQASVVLNSYGVDYIMGLLEAFLNRNIILSNFDEQRVYEICQELGLQMTDDIYNDYMRMGLDNPDKVKQYIILVWKVLINVEAALRRAIGGKERDSLRKVMSVTQNEPLMRMSQVPMVSQQQPRQRKLWNPMTWM